MEKASPPQYYPSGINSQPAVIVTTPQGHTPMMAFGPNPQHVTCPSCHSNITTQVKVEASSKTHMMAALLCLVCCCCCIPYCMDSCQNKNHYCQNCGAFLGTYAN